MATIPRYMDETPDGLSLKHNQVQPEIWANILRWLSTGMLPNASSINDHQEASTTSTSSQEQDEHLVCVPIPWETGPQMQGRKIAQFGSCRYDYVADVAEKCGPSSNDDKGVPPIPDYIRCTLLNGEHNPEQYTQCIINMYDSDKEIPWHLDHEYFGPEVLVYTFGEDRPLLLRKPLNEKSSTGNGSKTQKNGDNQENDANKMYTYTQVFPRHCSKYVLSGPARHVWEHSVPSGKGERVSITFRSWVGLK